MSGWMKMNELCLPRHKAIHNTLSKKFRLKSYSWQNAGQAYPDSVLQTFTGKWLVDIEYRDDVVKVTLHGNPYGFVSARPTLSLSYCDPNLINVLTATLHQELWKYRMGLLKVYLAFAFAGALGYFFAYATKGG